MPKITWYFFLLFLITFGCCCLANTLNSINKSSMARENDEKYKILVVHPETPKVALDLLSDKCEVIVCESIPPKRSEILEKVRGVHGLYWSYHEPLNAEILDAAGPQLKSISTMSAGIDYVDVAELKKRNIPLGHTPIVLNDAVADIAMGLLLAAARRFQEGREHIANSTWTIEHINWMYGRDIRDSKVGFFGFGHIGQTIAKRLSGFDIDEILYVTRTRLDEDIEKKFSARKVDFDTMLNESDFVIVAAPLTEVTRGIFNATAFGKMKKNAVLINIGRGPLVNQEDLYTALKTKQIFAAGLDVMVPEPLPANHPLMTLPNLILTPHIGSATQRTREDMATIAAHNVLRGLAGEPMFSPAY